jgi:hypothetical protein
MRERCGYGRKESHTPEVLKLFQTLGHIRRYLSINFYFNFRVIFISDLYQRRFTHLDLLFKLNIRIKVPL